jgi:hypothetical protein
MGKLFELLAAEKTLSAAADKLITETKAKFQKADTYFKGHIKTLKMLESKPENEAIENAARDEKTISTNVVDTLQYTLDHWAKAEDCIFQKNCTNQTATADLEYRGTCIRTGVPVDELMGLENRLKDLRGMIQEMPTLDASKDWEPDSTRGAGYWKAKNQEVTTKTEKQMTPVVLYAATDKHPAQVKEVSKDVVIGSFTQLFFSGAGTTVGKSEAIKAIDDMIVECRKARNRANTVETVNANIGSTIVSLIMQEIVRVA